MKKLFCLLLVLLFVPLLAFSESIITFDNHPEEYVGCWAINIPHSSTKFGDYVFLYVLNTDGTMSVFYSLNNYGDSSVEIRSAIGKWTEINGAIIYQLDGKDTYGILEIQGTTIWLEFCGALFGLQKIPLPDVSRVSYPDASDFE